jgi:hypothetical protein
MLQVEAKSGPSVWDSSDIVQKVIPIDVRLIFCFKYCDIYKLVPLDNPAATCKMNENRNY